MHRKKTSEQQSFSTPPVVAVLGHVDHGKTTLLDTIRKTSIAQKEHGGITQRIGASSVEIMNEGNKRQITFIDTPGHEAFVKMRGRGTQAADIGLLVISSTDGIMPQTKESISLLLESHIPFIVVLTKADLPEKNVTKIKQQLIKENVTLEEFGGDTPAIEVSAKTGSNITELLELILLVFDLRKPKPEENTFSGIVIESRLDQAVGPIATIVIKSGQIAIGDVIYTNTTKCKVRSLITNRGMRVKQATSGNAIEVQGFESVPNVGSTLQSQPFETKPQPIPSARTITYSPKKEDSGLAVVLCADTIGSLEAIRHALPQGITILLEKTGEITESDVLLAKSAKAIIIGFQAKIRNDILRLASSEKVLIKNYPLIYELLSELKDAAEGKRLSEEEKIYGAAKILASFPFEKTVVLGIRVLEGRVARGDKARLIRGEEIIGESNITSLRIGKDQTSKAEEGKEAGIIITPALDFAVGDMILCHS